MTIDLGKRYPAATIADASATVADASACAQRQGEEHRNPERGAGSMAQVRPQPRSPASLTVSDCMTKPSSSPRLVLHATARCHGQLAGHENRLQLGASPTRSAPDRMNEDERPIFVVREVDVVSSALH